MRRTGGGGRACGGETARAERRGRRRGSLVISSTEETGPIKNRKIVLLSSPLPSGRNPTLASAVPAYSGEPSAPPALGVLRSPEAIPRRI
jgi:hypothetical protein